MEEDEAEDCPFDKPMQPVQLSLFEGEKLVDEPEKVERDGQEIEQTCNENEDNAESKPSRKEIFEQLYRKHINDNYKKRKRAIIQGLLAHCKNYDDAKLFTELNLRRKRNNLIARRIRMTRKANLQDFTHFVTLTYSNELHTEESFKKGLGDCLKNLSKRQGWKCMGVWERSPEKQRLHFHGIFHIPDGTMPGQMIDVNDYNFKSHRRRITHQNTYFNERFGRSDFEEIVNDEVLGDAMLYIMKYIEKSGERIVYYGDLPRYPLSLRRGRAEIHSLGYVRVLG